MPIEIRELVVKVTVEDKKPQQRESLPPQELDTLKEQIIDECLQKLWKGLNRNMER
ncbi:hypothetical protein KTO58_13365 [Chitinophaga pendula]|uniref:DUF5908 family protein n=1 Tax=Chitinophaga TaxID=79328 RepID=UPI0012FD5906|nr:MULTISPECIES: DUF5908 family protein [Chitinophaga]UCJ10141.1 hypothetical protein KTO58_13365 [Chitinophaga pendula]